MADIMKAFRQAFGLDQPAPKVAPKRSDIEWARAELERRDRIIRALDAQVDAQRSSKTILSGRRHGDHR